MFEVVREDLGAQQQKNGSNWADVKATRPKKKVPAKLVLVNAESGAVVLFEICQG